MKEKAFKVVFKKIQPTLLFCVKEDKIEFEVVNGSQIYIDDLINLAITDNNIKEHLINFKPNPNLQQEKTDKGIRVYENHAKHSWAQSYSYLTKTVLWQPATENKIRKLQDYTWENFATLINALIQTDSKQSLDFYLNQPNIEKSYTISEL